jgi:hypothetical protein
MFDGKYLALINAAIETIRHDSENVNTNNLVEP